MVALAWNLILSVDWSTASDLKKLPLSILSSVVASTPVKPEPPPLNSVAVSVPVEELKVKFVPDLGGKLPVAAVTKRTLQEVS